MQALPRVAFLTVNSLRLTAPKELPNARNFSVLAVALHTRRTELNILVREAANLVGAGGGTYSRWETGEDEPSFRHWPRILSFLGRDPICDNPTTQAEQIAYICRHRGIYLEELAKLLGAHRHTVRALGLGQAAQTERLRRALLELVRESSRQPEDIILGGDVSG